MSSPAETEAAPRPWALAPVAVRPRCVAGRSGDRLAVLGLRRHHEPRPAASAARARSRHGRAAPGARAASRPGAGSESLADTPSHARGGALLLLRQRALRRHPGPAGVAVVAARGHLPAAAQHAGAHQRHRSRRVLVVPGGAAADACRASATWSPRVTPSAPGTPARSPPRPTSWRRCPRCTWPGRGGA